MSESTDIPRVVRGGDIGRPADVSNRVDHADGEEDGVCDDNECG